MNTPAESLEVLFEDNHCLAINKPAGLLSQGDITGDASAVDLARDYLKAKYAKPGNVFVGLVHRLDRPTSGVLLLARTSKGAERLSTQFREGTVRKVYWAVVESNGPDADPSALIDDGVERVWNDAMRKDERRNTVEVVSAGSPGSKEASLAYKVLGRSADACWLEVRPVTGRSHQIRVQLASRGLPIVGDRKYGARSNLLANDGLPRVALHAERVAFSHPTRQEAIEVSAPTPSDWPWPPRRGIPLATRSG
jgi:23S rRNA pseudouridine1911/1915/1917 synthase